jgi:hypothetical protein
MLCQEGRPLVVTIRVSFVSAVQVGSSNPLEQPLTPDDYSSQRTEEEPIPNTDDNDRDVVHTRHSDCDLSLTHETRHKTPARSILHTAVAFWRNCDTGRTLPTWLAFRASGSPRRRLSRYLPLPSALPAGYNTREAG